MRDVTDDQDERVGRLDTSLERRTVDVNRVDLDARRSVPIERIETRQSTHHENPNRRFIVHGSTRAVKLAHGKRTISRDVGRPSASQRE